MKYELIHEVWMEPDEKGQMLPSLCLAGPMGADFRAALNKAAIKVGEIGGNCHFAIMTKYWKSQGWGEYQSDCLNDFAQYPDQWIQIQQDFFGKK
ncbi:MAG: hypothetical protein ABF491_14025 [Acetobacter sp.]|uniref:hypothetical protein n=1 Tax=Acetobacter sp. TaxID=440 RepID=UPI0039ED7AF0